MSFVDRFARVLFVLGLAALALVYGYVARGWGLFPHGPLKRAGDALGAAAKFHLDRDYLEVPTRRERGGVTVRETAAMAPGATFLTLYTGERFLGRLVDASGATLHEWHAAFRDVWGADPPHVQSAGEDSIIEWHGVHLFPDGGVLLNFEGHLFPYGGGLVRLDRDSRVVWRLARNTHHDVEVTDDGATIWVPSLNYRPRGMPELPRFEPWFYEDTILKVSAADGRVLDEISVPLALRSLPGLLGPRSESFDPTHLNDIDVIPATPGAGADAGFAALRPGHLLVSLRNLDAVVAIDPERKAATWVLTGPFRRQHDPQLLPDGRRMLVFDNLGGDPACGRSRILEIDPAVGSFATRYDGCLSGDRFESEAWGGLQQLPNGNLLIAESFRGRVIEVTGGPRPRIVWEYVNLIGERGGRRVAGVVGAARRFAPGELTFLATPTAEAHAGP